MWVKFLPLDQMERRTGILNLVKSQKHCNHFGLLTIFLVLEEHEMIC